MTKKTKKRKKKLLGILGNNLFFDKNKELNSVLRFTLYITSLKKPNLKEMDNHLLSLT